MSEKLTIGKVARLSGVPTKTIRFYEDEGLVPRPPRSDAGYRLYTEGDVSRLQLVRRARLLGIDLASIKALLTKALHQDCATFGEELTSLLAAQRTAVERQLAELTALRDELARLQDHVIHCCEGCDPAGMASECSFCGLMNQEEGGASDASQHR